MKRLVGARAVDYNLVILAKHPPEWILDAWYSANNLDGRYNIWPTSERFSDEDRLVLLGAIDYLTDKSYITVCHDNGTLALLGMFNGYPFIEFVRTTPWEGRDAIHMAAIPQEYKIARELRNYPFPGDSYHGQIKRHAQLLFANTFGQARYIGSHSGGTAWDKFKVSPQGEIIDYRDML